MPSVTGSYAALVLVLAGFAYTCHFPIPAVVTVPIWGAIAFALISPLQIWVVDAASDAPNLASTLNQSAFNLGNSIGAWAGGTAIAFGLSYAGLPWIGATVAAIGLGLTLISSMHRQRVPA